MRLKCDICHRKVKPQEFVAKKDTDCVNYTWKCPVCNTMHGASVPKECLENGLYGKQISTSE